jgi:Arc/MetJ-type ribon-helix-helix transcriptional regulator
MRTTKSVTISLPPEQLKNAERLAKKQNRTMSELFREGLRRLEQEDRSAASSSLRDLATVIREIQEASKRAGLDKMTMEEIDAEIAAARQEMRAKFARKARPDK